MLAGDRPIIRSLISAAIDQAADCVRQRVLLRAVDWSTVDAAEVERLFENLAAESVRPPLWLLQALLAAGHVAPSEQTPDSALHALNTLNRLARDGVADGSAIATAAADLSVQEHLAPELSGAAIKRLATLGATELAARLALVRWRDTPQELASLHEPLAALIATMPAARLRVTGFSTTHTLVGDLRSAFATVGFRADIEEADFGQALRELLNPSAEPRDALLLLVDFAGLHQEDWRQEPERRLAALEHKLVLLASAIATYVDKNGSPVLINTLPPHPAPTAGHVDRQHSSGAAAALHLINDRLNAIAHASGHVILIDGALALADLAAERMVDPKLWYYGRIPFAPEATRRLALAFARAYRGLKAGPAKVLALDFDNTLWGGVYGDDGVAALRCDDEFPGNAFKAFQQECLRLKSQGMVLVGLSKNNPDAVDAFATHPGMALRLDDFAAHRVNWEPKAASVRSIAEELSLGLESFVFIDDSPHEREAMRRLCPEVIVPEMPLDVAARPNWLRNLYVTWPIRMTAEDGRRSEMYRAEQRRVLQRSNAASLDDYFRGLEQVLIVGRTNAARLARVAQLHMRTNQFNLTTARFDEPAIKAMLDDLSHLVMDGRASDKFGEHGLVICATVKIEGAVASIASFLMSCRVIGRGIEMAFLGEVLRELGQRSVSQVDAAFIPTKKNGMVREFYRNAGFTHTRTQGDTEHWTWEFAGGNEKPGSAFVLTRQSEE